MAPDGALVKEGRFPTIEAAWSRASDMGSRWWFYPVCLVTGPSISDRARIVAAPDGAKQLEGFTLRTVARLFAANEQHVCDWINGKCPLEISP